MASRKPDRKEIPALKVHQWLPQWDRFDYSVIGKRRKPLPYFFVFSMDARELRLLAGVNRRTRSAPGIDTGIQRRHEQGRSEEISRYVRNGFPFSILTEVRREEPENQMLRKPGWLPTAIVVNILTKSDMRAGYKVAQNDLVEPRDANGTWSISLPVGFNSAWTPNECPPLEVIDGQHRLFAFGGSTPSANFDLPVVAFFGLDISWQAYLFWTINIKPKKINPSLAFDLYPLLRTEDWLDVQEPFGVYRETRAQELVEILWSYPKSAWHLRIDMIGERGRGTVSQASFVRSLLATIIKRREGKGVSIGGLFGAPLSDKDDPLEWSRPQQGAFLILFWQLLRSSVEKSKEEWALSLREAANEDKLADPAFFSRNTLLNQDQGVRVVLHVLNDLTFVLSRKLKLQEWTLDQEGDPGDTKVIDAAISSLRTTAIARYMSKLANELCTFDWRSANASGLTDAERRTKLIYRGSGGYRNLRLDLLQHLAESSDSIVCGAARQVKLRMRAERT